ncbi:NADH oxidase family-domain-containing protein [Mycena epipterygia]|nr:NADH oxidase family-domain-containing protein [Mycena epipterygia]
MSKLFEPLTVGTVALQHRVVVVPMTRLKASTEHVPYLPLVSEYYTQRASKPGTLLITESTFIAARAGGSAHVPGIWSPEQIAAWKVVTESVHAKGSFVFMQLWALGRSANSEYLATQDPTFPYVSASDVQQTGKDKPPRPLTVSEIKEYAGLYAQAAKNAVEAGCDGVEIHSANGYLPDQFLQDVTNKRTDDYGGSIENRARFVLEILGAVVSAIGAEKTAIRFSPWSPFQGMGMADPVILRVVIIPGFPQILLESLFGQLIFPPIYPRQVFCPALYLMFRRAHHRCCMLNHCWCWELEKT